MLRPALALAALCLALVPTASASLAPEGDAVTERIGTDCFGVETTGPAMIVRDLGGGSIEIFVGVPIGILLEFIGVDLDFMPGGMGPYTGAGVYVGGPNCEITNFAI